MNKPHWPYLCKIQVDEIESEELQTHGEAVEQPVGSHRQVVGLHSVTEVKREESGSEGSPQEAEEQEDALVAPSFVSVQVEEPELYVDHQKEPTIQNRVEDREA